jgi:hypothetical protein
VLVPALVVLVAPVLVPALAVLVALFGSLSGLGTVMVRPVFSPAFGGKNKRQQPPDRGLNFAARCVLRKQAAAVKQAMPASVQVLDHTI